MDIGTYSCSIINNILVYIKIVQQTSQATFKYDKNKKERHISSLLSINI